MLEVRAEMQTGSHVNECDLFFPILTKFGDDWRHLVKVFCIEILKKMSKF
jgi:hypothetical protein